MPANVFVDSNICLYVHDKRHAKFLAAKTILESNPSISTQVILENINVCLKKFKQTKSFALAHAKSLQQACTVLPITNSTMTKAMIVFERYGYSIFDSLIIASALEAGCKTLYSEDLHHGQVIEGKLTIVNPFFSIA